MTPFEILTRDALDQLSSDSDRAVAIVGAAIIDNALRSLILAAMRDDQAVANELFQPIGSLGALGTKARLAYMLSLIEKHGYDDIVLVEKIRNKLAHELEWKDFDHPRIVTMINKFSNHAMSLALLKLKYGDAAPPMRALFMQALYSLVDRTLAHPPLDPTTIIARRV